VRRLIVCVTLALLGLGLVPAAASAYTFTSLEWATRVTLIGHNHEPRATPVYARNARVRAYWTVLAHTDIDAEPPSGDWSVDTTDLTTIIRVRRWMPANAHWKLMWEMHHWTEVTVPATAEEESNGYSILRFNAKWRPGRYRLEVWVLLTDTDIVIHDYERFRITK
jgi:hypothetical protein